MSWRRVVGRAQARAREAGDDRRRCNYEVQNLQPMVSRPAWYSPLHLQVKMILTLLPLKGSPCLLTDWILAAPIPGVVGFHAMFPCIPSYILLEPHSNLQGKAPVLFHGYLESKGPSRAHRLRNDLTLLQVAPLDKSPPSTGN